MPQHGSKYFARRPPPIPWGWGQYVKIQLFQNIVMLHIKLKRITKRSNMVANVLPADPPPPRGDWVSKSKLFFSEHGHIAYQIKENHKCSNMEATILPANILTPP